MVKEVLRKLSSGMTALTLCLSLVTALPSSIITAHAQDSPDAEISLSEPAHTKELTDRGDGTYDLSLSVTGSSKKSAEQTKADVVIVFDTSGSMGKKISNKPNETQTRMSTAQTAVNGLIDTLLKNNTTASPDSIEISLVSFSTHSKAEITGTTGKAELTSVINGFESEGGTNWEAALQTTWNLKLRSDAEHYVIFISDGAPTFRNSRMDKNAEKNYYGVYGNGQNDNSGYNYSAALNAAKKLVDNGYELYTVNAFGNAGKMESLVRDAYGDQTLQGHYFEANDSTTLNKAFSSIVQSIMHSVTYRNVTIEDTMTLETGIVPSFTYLVTDREGKTVNNGLTVTHSDGTTHTLPEASYDPDTRKVTWALGTDYTLEDGYTYRVSFEVYPTQETIDQIADYTNHPEKYDVEKTPDIIQTQSGFSIHTNQDAVVKYHVVTTENDQETVGDELTADYNRPRMPVNPVMVNLTKEWLDTTDSTGRIDAVSFNILKDGTVIDTVTLSKDTWSTEYALAAGIVNKNGKVLAAGHIYTFQEVTSSNLYESTTGATKPMYVNGVLKEGKSGTYTAFDADHKVIAGTNSRKGQLVITKKVESIDGGKQADAEDEFTVTVTMSTEQKFNFYNADGTYVSTGQVNAEEPRAFTMKAGESIVFNAVSTGTEYTVSESGMPEGYTKRETVYSNSTQKIQADQKDTVEIINDYGVIEAAKVWDDHNNQDGMRQAVSFELETSIDGSTFTKVSGSERTVGTTDQETVIWNGLPVLDSAGNRLAYCVVETGNPEGYTSEVSGSDGSYVITNTHSPEKVTISGRKTWIDNADQDGKRPQSITVNLLRNNEVIRSATVTAADNWTYSFTGLDKYENGNLISYRVSEEEVSDYTASYSTENYDITNTHNVEKKSITVNKVWDDNSNQDGIRPTSVSVSLLADNVPVKTVTIHPNENGIWSYTFEDLDVYCKGNEIAYSVVENNVREGYSADISTSGNVVTIINTHTPETTTVSGTKSWNDNNNQDGLRPTSITVNLLADNVVTATKTVTAQDNWTYTFADLPKFRNGTEIRYSVEEVTVNGYEASYPEETYDIENTHSPETTSISGTKVWNDGNNQDGIRTGSVEIILKADGVETARQTVTSDDWSFTFDNLPKYKNGGTAIVYTLEEVVPKGYLSSVEKDQETGLYTITNTHIPEKTTINGAKVWSDDDNRDGIRPESITVNLLADGVKAADTTVSVGSDGNWTYTFENVPKYSNGKLIQYTVSEEKVSGYTTDINGFNITNTHEPEKTSVTVTKDWLDDNNRDGIRPSSITVNLFADGEKVADGTVSADSNGIWTYTFSNLYRNDNGKPITYTVTEETVSGYTTGINGTTITNTHVIETTSISGEKAWIDNGDQDGKRHTSIIVNLLANGEQVSSQEVSAATGWKYTFSNLPVNENGQKITYTITETLPQDSPYVSTVSGYDLINTYDPETTAVNVSKVWNDNDNQDNMRKPVTVRLFADGAETQTMTLSDENGWSGSFTGLAKFRDGGTEIVYTISEDKVEGYTTDIQPTDHGYVIANTHTPQTTFISGTKSWDDNSNQDGIRPAQVTIRLLNDAGLPEKVTTASENTGWAYSFTDLPVYWNGNKVNYTLREDAVKDYVSQQSGTDFTNTHAPLVIEKLTGKKSWDDAENQDGKRPESITVRLLADGQPAVHQDGSPVEAVRVTEETGWNYTFENLPVNRNGAMITYTVSEDSVEGYDPVSSQDGLSITNVHIPEKYPAVFGHKVWDDGGNVDGKRPDSITVHLYANGTQAYSSDGTPYTAVVSGDDWNFMFENVDKYADGKLIEYTIVEDEVEDYETPVVTGSVEEGFTITNTHIPETIDRISGHKIWQDDDNRDGIRPQSITVRLYADGEEVSSTTTSISSGWYYEFTDLPKYSDGKEIVYRVEEDGVEGYDTDVEQVSEYEYNFINTHELQRIEISGEKVWDDNSNQDGIRPESIIVHLYADGRQAYDVNGNECTAEVSGDDWSFAFTDVYRYANAREIRYSIVEEPVAGYDAAVVEGSAEKGFRVINHHTPETVESIHGHKVWDDGDDQDGKRPEIITVRLYANGQEAAIQNVTADRNWEYEFLNMPKYSDGKEIVYTVSEDHIAGYTASVEQISAYESVITNTHTPETAVVYGVKEWNDHNDESGKRPGSIRLILKADGEKIAETTAEAALDWFFSFGELPVYDHGHQIVYTVSEVEVDGYRTSISGDVQNGFTVRNTLAPETPLTPEQPVIRPGPETPNTSDRTDIAMYAGFGLAAVIAAIAMLVIRREHEN
ncbi:MAG: Cna B-type domain-containing protein [Bulleidia sp.]